MSENNEPEWNIDVSSPIDIREIETIRELSQLKEQVKLMQSHIESEIEYRKKYENQ